MTSRNQTYQFGIGYQRKLAASLFRDRDLLPTHRSALKEHYFDDPYLRDISGAMLAHFDKHRVSPTADAAVELVRVLSLARPEEGDRLLAVLEDLFNEDLSDLPDVRSRAVDFAVTQACLGALSRSLEIVEEGEGLDRLPGLFTDALSVGHREDDLGLDYLLDRERFFLTQDDRAFPGGLPTLDRWLGGGFGPGELIVLCASTGLGKTWAKVNFAKSTLLWGKWPGDVTPHAKPPKSVVWITLEMPPEQVAGRFDQVLFGLKRGTPKGEIEAALDSLVERALGHLVIKKMRAHRDSTQDVRSYLTRLEAKGKIHRGSFLLVIDYPRLLRPPRLLKGDSGHREIQETYLDCRNVADEWQVPCLGGIQTSRGGYNKRHVTPQDFAGAYDVACDADVILAICQTLQERRLVPSEKRILVCKSRTGVDGRELAVTYDEEVQGWCEKGEVVPGAGKDSGNGESEVAKKHAAAKGARPCSGSKGN
jgi:hypothetical protein